MIDVNFFQSERYNQRGQRAEFFMSLPYHRGQVTTNMNNRTGTGWGTRDQRVEEANRTLMEQENDRKWVRDHAI